jgi:hypothetical protein
MIDLYILKKKMLKIHIIDVLFKRTSNKVDNNIISYQRGGFS